MKQTLLLLLLIACFAACYKSNETPVLQTTTGINSTKAVMATQPMNTRIQLFYLSKEPKQVFKLPEGAQILDVENIKEKGRISVELNPAQTVKENRTFQVVELSLNGGDGAYVDAKMPAGYECIFIGQYTLDYSEFFVYEVKKNY